LETVSVVTHFGISIKYGNQILVI